MKILLSIVLFVISVNASVKIYKNNSELSYIPTTKFIGFNKNIKAFNEDGDIKIIKSSCINNSLDKCQKINSINELIGKNNSLVRQKIVMQKALDNFYTDYKNIDENILYISQMSDNISGIDKQINKNNFEIEKIKQRGDFRVNSPYYLDNIYKKNVKINFRGISFYSKYILDLDNSSLNHSLSITNNSGVNLDKTSALIFDRNYYSSVENIAFNPSTVRKINNYGMSRMERDESNYFKAGVQKSKKVLSSISTSETSTSKISTKNYKIKNFSLLANGIEKKFLVDSVKIKIKRETIWRAWQNAVYIQGTFAIIDTLENNIVDMIYNNSRVKNVFLRVEDNNMVFNIAQEHDLKVLRKEIPTFSQSKGFLNSDTEIKKTIQLLVTNTSNKEKKFLIYEKIPISTDGDIKVKLNYFIQTIGEEKIKVNIQNNKKNGKIILEVLLKPKEYKKFIYEYAIRHPKKVKIFITK